MINLKYMDSIDWADNYMDNATTDDGRAVVRLY